MQQADIERYREKLIALSRRLSDSVAGLRDDTLMPSGGDASGSPSHHPHHLADLGTDLALQQTKLALLEHETARLADVNAALGRIEDDTYGRCQRCHGPIATARLEALPSASHCILCAELLERQAADEAGTTRPPRG